MVPKHKPGSLSAVKKKLAWQKIDQGNFQLGNSIMTVRSCVPDRTFIRKNSIEKDYLANLTKRTDRVGRVDPLVYASNISKRKMRSVISSGYGTR